MPIDFRRSIPHQRSMYSQQTRDMAGSMLAHRLRRWPNIEPTYGQCPMFAGLVR